MVVWLQYKVGACRVSLKIRCCMAGNIQQTTCVVFLFEFAMIAMVYGIYCNFCTLFVPRTTESLSSIDKLLFVSGSNYDTFYAHFISIHAGLGSSHLPLLGIKFAIISSFLVTNWKYKVLCLRAQSKMSSHPVLFFIAENY